MNSATYKRAFKPISSVASVEGRNNLPPSGSVAQQEPASGGPMSTTSNVLNLGESITSVTGRNSGVIEGKGRKVEKEAVVNNNEIAKEGDTKIVAVPGANANFQILANACDQFEALYAILLACLLKLKNWVGERCSLRDLKPTTSLEMRGSIDLIGHETPTTVRGLAE